MSLFYYMYNNNNHHLSNIRFVNETVQQIANYKGTELLYVGLDISISQDYVISNYDNPKHYNVTMETRFGPDFLEWTKATYLQNGEFYAKAISEYIHGLSNANDILIDNTNATQVNLSGNWSSGNILLGYFGTDYISAPSGTPSSATFSATIPTAGKYEIFTRWVSSPNFDSKAPATFTYSGGTDSFSLNITSRGGNWISLGNYDLAASEQVAFSIYNTNATKTVVAGGFRISKVVDCNALSTAEILPEQTGIELYPNPAKNQVHIKIGNNGKLLVVNFYNAIGQNVLTSKNKSVDISTLISGNYIVEILTDKLRETKKLIVK